MSRKMSVLVLAIAPASRLAGQFAHGEQPLTSINRLQILRYIGAVAALAA
jgi:hypothetical protein